MSLSSRASQIKNEKVPGANTANRVGSLFEDIVSEFDVRDSANRDRANHVGTQAISTVDGLSSALANGLDRANHVGTQAISTIDGLQTELDSKQEVISLGLYDFWLEDRFTHNNSVQSSVVGSAISSGTISTGVPTASLNGRYPHGVFIRSSTTANGGYRFRTASFTTDYFGVIPHKLRCIFQWRTSFVGRTVRIGYLDTTTVADSTDGAYFEIIGDQVSCKTANNSVRTTNVMTLTINLDVHYLFDIEVDGAGVNARFRVWNADSGDLLLDVTNTTNIPVTSARAFGTGIVATESSTTASDIGILKYLGWGTLAAFNKMIG